MILLRESQEFGSIKLITEGKNDLFIEGVFAQSESKNRNGRMYPKSVMESAVREYVSEFVVPKRAIGELSHPENRPTPRPELASHLVTVFEMRGTDVHGKAKILNTPQGQIVRGLLEGGVNLGVSTRALGSVKESQGVNIVQSDFKLFAVDVVSDPSGIDCWVNAVNESTEWVVMGDGQVLEKYKAQLKSSMTESHKMGLFANFLSDISKLR